MKRRVLNLGLTVKKIQSISPYFIRIVFTPEMPLTLNNDWIMPNLKLLFPQSAQLTFPDLNDEGKILWKAGERESIRTYSLRDYHPAENELIVDFSIHAHGVGTSWAQQAVLGDRIGLIRMGSKMNYSEADHWILIGDQTALPGILYTLSHSPKTTNVTAILDLPDNEISSLISEINTYRDSSLWCIINPQRTSEQLVDKLSQYPWPTQVGRLKIAGGLESRSAQAVRHLLDHVYPDLARQDRMISGYWREGFAEGEFKRSE